jgi:hypothetical protein
MIPGSTSVRKVSVVTEDVFGPMRNSLYVEFVDGKSLSIDKNRDMQRFVDELERDRPQAAASIRAALSKVGELCTEQVFDFEE